MQRLFVLLALATGCSGSAGTSPDAGPAPDASSPSDASGDAGAAGWMPLPTGAACAAPTVGEPITIDLTYPIAPRWGRSGAELALVYVTSDVAPRSLSLQRFDAAGQLTGDPIPIFSTDDEPSTSIASDGSIYVVCYATLGAHESGGCASVPVGGGAVTPLVEIPAARDVAVTYGPGGFAVAYHEITSLTGGPVEIATLDVAGQRLGTPTHIDDLGVAEISLAATTNGYVLALNTDLRRFDDRLAPIGDPIAVTYSITSVVGPVDSQPRSVISLSSMGDEVGLAWEDNDGLNSLALAAVFDSSAGTFSTPLTYSSVQHGFPSVAIAAGSDGLALTAFEGTAGPVDNTTAYRTLDRSGGTLSTPVPIPSGRSPNVTSDLVATEDGFLVAIASDFDPEAILVVPLRCP